MTSIANCSSSSSLAAAVFASLVCAVGVISCVCSAVCVVVVVVVVTAVVGVDTSVAVSCCSSSLKPLSGSLSCTPRLSTAAVRGLPATQKKTSM